MKMTDNIDYIAKNISEGDILCQLAEEASELAHAALKLKRAIEGTNPTPISKYEAMKNLVEEMVDISLCSEIIEEKFSDSLPVDWGNDIYINKSNRWCQRLKNIKCD